MDNVKLLEKLNQQKEDFYKEVGKIIIGQNDVIEHIFCSEESNFLSNLTASLNDNAVCIIGTPNIRADEYASKYSQEAHVNLKDHTLLEAIGDKYFQNYFIFGMNDEVLHTGYDPMCNYLWSIGAGVKPEWQKIFK